MERFDFFGFVPEVLEWEFFFHFLIYETDSLFRIHSEVSRTGGKDLNKSISFAITLDLKRLPYGFSGFPYAGNIRDLNPLNKNRSFKVVQ